MTSEIPIEQPSSISSLESVCVLSLRGISNQTTLKYTLENGSQFYEFKITGKIEEVDASTNIVLIYLNGENPIPPKTLIGVTINKGDNIVILENKPVGRSSSVYFVVSNN